MNNKPINNYYDDCDFIFKILVLGDTGVGKTTLLKKIKNNKFNKEFLSTIGVDFFSVPCKINDKKIKLHIWDTAGQEKFRAIVKNFFRNINGVIYIADISDIESIKNIEYWINEVKSNTSNYDDIQSIVVINKEDLININSQEYTDIIDNISTITNKYNLKFVLVSTKNADFEYLETNIIKKISHKIFNHIIETGDKSFILPNNLINLNNNSIKSCCSR